MITRLRTAGCVFAEDEADLLLAATKDPDQLEQLVDRRIDGEPLEHLLGWAEFCGLRVAVAAGVFVPRRRTEFLVEQAIAHLAAGDRALDLCCGCGAIGLAIKTARPTIELHCTELDPVAAHYARKNVGTTGAVYVGDLFAALPSDLRRSFAVIVANVPYVPTDDIDLMPSEARLHEPRAALDGGDDGLAVLRQVAYEAPAWLRPGGALLIETSQRQSATAVEAFVVAGMTATTSTSVDLGATVITGVNTS